VKKPSETAYEELKRPLLALGFARPGSLIRRFMPCGKPSCRCAAGRAAWHGPYCQLTWKTKGKTITRRLSDRQARRCLDWLANHRTLKKMVRKMVALSIKETDRLLQEISSE